MIIANTSNMPVLARETSIYTGITVAEYYRDMGYDVVGHRRLDLALGRGAARGRLADRRAARRGGLPGRAAVALAAFYERAGRVLTLGGVEASVTVIASVSPPGGDKTEPVTAHTRRFVRCLWSLDRDLAAARHYPAVSWSDSSRATPTLAGWHASHGDAGWRAGGAAMALLAEAERLRSVADLIGTNALPDHERIVLLAARLIQETVLQQSALSADDAYCSPAKQAALLELVLGVHGLCLELVGRGTPPPCSRRSTCRTSRERARLRGRTMPPPSTPFAASVLHSLAGGRMIRSPVEYTVRQSVRGPLIVVGDPRRGLRRVRRGDRAGRRAPRCRPRG